MRTTRNTDNLFLRTALLVAVCGILYPTLALSYVVENTSDTSVVNNVSITSSSGGNSAVGGEVIEGEASATIDIETVVNGETIEDIHETYTGDELDSGVTVESSHQGENVSVETSVEASVNDKDGSTQTQVSEESETVSVAIDIETDEDEEQFSTQQVAGGSGLIGMVTNFFAYVFSFFNNA